jgi:hypothetical protein
MSFEKNQEEYMSYVTDLLDGMQTLPSIEFICGVTRMGKEIANSKPVNITKEFDDLTGDVMYNGVTITKDHWSTSIPRTVQKFKSQLSSLFECENLLDHVLNPNNKMVLAGSDTTVTVMDDMGAVVKVINVVNDVIPKAIEGLWRLGYLCRSSSVSRGGGSQNVVAKTTPLLW